MKQNKVILIIISACLATTFGLYFYGKEKALAKPPQGESIMFSVKVSETLERNNRVGNDWITKATVNGNQLKTSQDISVNTSGNLSLYASATESDKVPDTRSASRTIAVSSLDMRNKNVFSLDVMVKENKGRYTGNTALWKFTFTIQRKVGIVEAFRNIF